ncbi:TlpA disulfide reductase family protein [Niabella drilacis]|uniref:Thiol-disulfide isomerase or thioredoxin n=1 Tax=Niabella drilacis (strain DSM 25811 / CCM 8410 / CCUG 62505 / LMG 26954 / E90) TaxID=1285928 RepID=A0A1G7AZ67_NIADE|nr:TlpA disulfide reductase family protein [Niabella drilacis]SDE19877.1 Thiol-disulfide isomerase or thioredoxin [Niabella drilacis]
MRTLVLFFFFSICLSISHNKIFSQNQFQLSGKFDDLKDGQLIIELLTEHHEIDTITIKNHGFRYRGTVAGPSIARLYFYPSESAHNTAALIIVPGQTSIKLQKDSLKYFQLQNGTEIQKQLIDLTTKKKPFLLETELLESQLQTDTGAYLPRDSISLQLTMSKKEIANLDSAFIVENPKSFISAFIIAQNLNFERFTLDAVDNYYKQFPSSIQKSTFGKEIFEKLQIADKISKGKPAPSFIANDIHGKEIRLESLKGKYVLLDFWASWCFPCRRIYPVLKRYYKASVRKDFEIISISCDGNLTEWKNALIKDQTMDWINVLDKKNSLFNKYMVNGIPVLILIDKQGKIVDRFERQEKGYHTAPIFALFPLLKNLLKLDIE